MDRHSEKLQRAYDRVRARLNRTGAYLGRTRVATLSRPLIPAGRAIILTPLARHSSEQLNAFVRVERYDTQAAVPAGVVPDPFFARRITTVGLFLQADLQYDLQG